MRQDLSDLLKELYARTCRWQTENDIRVELSQDEFTGLWSKYRLDKLAKLLDKGGDSLERYLRHPHDKPVCGWINRDARDTGVLTKDNAKIMMASEQRKLFQFKSGDSHSPETIQKMRKPKSKNARGNMSIGAKRRWEKYRAEKAAAQGAVQ